MGKKEKLIENAQKLLQKGQIDKALKEYQEALGLDPADQRLRQRLAELLTKANRFDEARAEFDQIGKNLAGNGFYLKAIAVYKQIEKLFPEDITVVLTLASLNEKHGLTAQAMAEYKRAYDYYERVQNMAETVKILDAMQKVDPHNVNIRLKQAEVLHQLGKRDESFSVFSDLAGVLIERRDDAAFGRLSARIGQLFPERSDFTCDVLEQQVELGNAESAALALHQILKTNPNNIRVWQLIVASYQRLGQQAKIKTACQHFSRYYPEELLPKEQYARCLLLEKDVEGLLTFLELNESIFIKNARTELLVEFYSSMAELAPVDVRVLKGGARACNAAGDQEKAALFSANIVALSTARSQQVEASAPVVEEELIIALPEDDTECLEAQPEIGSDAELPEFGEISFAEEAPQPAQPGADLDDMYEIEIELDLDSDTEPVAPQAVSSEDWFDTVSDIFDAIGTAPGKVKFAGGLENNDSQSHYDLGMAFREMGLYDEAINEFRKASEDPQRRVECLIQQAACLRDKGELDLAENALQSLLTAPALSLDDSSAIKYELAITCEVAGRVTDAAVLYAEIEAANPAFRDVKARLEHAGAGGDKDGFDFNEDDLLDFELK